MNRTTQTGYKSKAASVRLRFMFHYRIPQGDSAPTSSWPGAADQHNLARRWRKTAINDGFLRLPHRSNSRNSLRVPPLGFTVASPFQFCLQLVLLFGFALLVLSFLTLVLHTTLNK